MCGHIETPRVSLLPCNKTSKQVQQWTSSTSGIRVSLVDCITVEGIHWLNAAHLKGLSIQYP